MLKQCKDLPIMLKNIHVAIMQAWQHLALHLLYSERLDSARLL